MNIWKDLEKHGRNGDTMMKKIDGDLAHVNAVENEMSSEYIKEHGSGTINPATGKKEYWLPIAAAALSIGGSIFKGFSAMGNKGLVEEGRAGALENRDERLGMLGEQKDLAGAQARLSLAGAQSQLTSGVEDLSIGTNIAGRNLQASIGGAIGQSNLASSGAINFQQQQQSSDLLDKYKSDMSKLFDSRQLATRQKDLSLSRADLAYRQGEMSAEDAYQSTITQLESTPGASGGIRGFFEGMFS